MDAYPAKFQRDGDGFVVTFPDIPEAISGGGSIEEAVAQAQDALEVALLTYARDGRAIPAATRGRQRDGVYRLVSVPATIAAKIAFMIAFRQSGLTRVALAAKLGKGETEVRRMLDPYHNTKLATLEAGLQSLGKRLVVTVEEAA